MTVCSESANSHVLAADDARRARRELLLEWVFRPLSNALVPVLARLHVPPLAVLLANAAAGLLAAFAIAKGELVVAALLLQVKTLLDNSDGQLARVTHRVTLLGRYLDTIADLVVNAALFVALADLTGHPLLALAGLVALTLALTVDFNVSELAREVHCLTEPDLPPSGGRAERALALVYRALFAPQDRLVRAFSNRRLERAVGREAGSDALRAYFDPLTLSTLANLGLTTQLAVLGVCLALGVPTLYLVLAIASVAVLVPLQLRREHLARRAAGR